jgi:hypothetical protein
MRRPWLILTALALVLLLSFFSLWWFLADKITPANAALITPGISLKQVNELLDQQGRRVNELLPGAEGENHYIWEGSLGEIHVAFRGSLLASDPAVFVPVESLRAKLRRLFP